MNREQRVEQLRLVIAMAHVAKQREALKPWPQHPDFVDASRRLELASKALYDFHLAVFGSHGCTPEQPKRTVAPTKTPRRKGSRHVLPSDQ